MQSNVPVANAQMGSVSKPGKENSDFASSRKSLVKIGMMIGYAIFYFCRKNFSMAMPYFLSDMGYTKTDLGIILTLFSIVYGVSKFCNGILADRSNAR